jgi:hypothetical protein
MAHDETVANPIRKISFEPIPVIGGAARAVFTVGPEGRSMARSARVSGLKPRQSAKAPAACWTNMPTPSTMRRAPASRASRRKGARPCRYGSERLRQVLLRAAAFLLKHRAIRCIFALAERRGAELGCDNM